MKRANIFVGRVSKGCKICLQGRSLVICVTEICNKHCFYCPFPLYHRTSRDMPHVNGRIISKDTVLLDEARMIDAAGAALTGGEPTMSLDRTVHYINILKKNFGEHFYIHLYTVKNNISKSELNLLYNAGLDELRFHLYSTEETTGLQRALSFNWSVGIEIPAIPGEAQRMTSIIKLGAKLGVKFININELMVNASNYRRLKRKGFSLYNTDTNNYSDMRNIYNIYNYGGVKGSAELAIRLIREVGRNKNLKIPALHFCSLKSKQYVQVANKLTQRAKKVIFPYEEITWKGTLISGKLESKSATAIKKIRDLLIDGLKVSPGVLKLERNRLMMPWHLVIKAAALSERIPASFTINISERYPFEEKKTLLQSINKVKYEK